MWGLPRRRGAPRRRRRTRPKMPAVRTEALRRTGSAWASYGGGLRICQSALAQNKKSAGLYPRFKPSVRRCSAVSAGLGLRVFGPLHALAFGWCFIVGGLGGRHRRVIQWRAPAQGRPQRGDLALQAGIVPAGGFQRALDHGPLHAFALQCRIEILNALLDIGAANLDVRFQMAVALSERSDLFFGARQTGFAHLQGLGQRVVALGQGRARLLVVPDLALAGLVLRFDLRKTLFSVVAGDRRFD